MKMKDLDDIRFIGVTKKTLYLILTISQGSKSTMEITSSRFKKNTITIKHKKFSWHRKKHFFSK